ncbi:MAG: cytochrome c [Bryobacteraceae bacterium]|nr:cytochrome c [Bryobacteraceae bacterium]
MSRAFTLALAAIFAAVWTAPAPSRKAPPWEKPKQVARYLYLENCSICHDLSKPKSPKMGPTLVRFKTAPPAARESLRKYIMFKIRSGGIKMPKFGDVLSEDQIRRLADYLLPDD